MKVSWEYIIYGHPLKLAKNRKKKREREKKGSLSHPLQCSICIHHKEQASQTQTIVSMSNWTTCHRWKSMKKMRTVQGFFPWEGELSLLLKTTLPLWLCEGMHNFEMMILFLHYEGMQQVYWVDTIISTPLHVLRMSLFV